MRDRVGVGVVPTQGRELPEQRLRVRAELGTRGEGEVPRAAVWAQQAPHGAGAAGVRTWLSDQVFLKSQECASLQEFTHFESLFQ